MNKKIVGITLVCILAVVLAGSYFLILAGSYLLFGKPRQTANDASTSTEPANSSFPSVPEFAVELIDSSHDVPTTYSIDPYTGKNVTHEGYHAESRTIEVTIKNQPFVSYYDNNSGWTIDFYYNIRIKGHYSENWTELYRASDGYQPQSGSEYTVVSYQGEYSPTSGMDVTMATKMTTFPPGGQVDFQVKAMIGYVSRVNNPNWTNQLEMYPYVFTGETSDWSETRTITIS